MQTLQLIGALLDSPSGHLDVSHMNESSAQASMDLLWRVSILPSAQLFERCSPHSQLLHSNNAVVGPISAQVLSRSLLLKLALRIAVVHEKLPTEFFLNVTALPTEQALGFTISRAMTSDRKLVFMKEFRLNGETDTDQRMKVRDLNIISNMASLRHLIAI